MKRVIFLTIAILYSLFSFSGDPSTHDASLPQKVQAPVQMQAVAVRVPTELLSHNFHEAPRQITRNYSKDDINYICCQLSTLINELKGYIVEWDGLAEKDKGPYFERLISSRGKLFEEIQSLIAILNPTIGSSYRAQT